MTIPSFGKKLAEARADLQIVRDGHCHWAVVSKELGNSHREGGIMVVYGGLESREAAELALEEATSQLAYDGVIHGPYEVAKTRFDAAGAFLRRLREAGVGHDALEGLAWKLFDTATVYFGLPKDRSDFEDYPGDLPF